MDLSAGRLRRDMPYVTCSRIVSPNNTWKKEGAEVYSNLNESERNRLWGLFCLLAFNVSGNKNCSERPRIIENLMESEKPRLFPQSIKELHSLPVVEIVHEASLKL